MPEIEFKFIAATSKRHFKNMSLTYGDTGDALKNREEFLNELGVDYRDLVCAGQVHAAGVRYATEVDKGKGALSSETAVADTDAFITDRRSLPLAIFTADCLPIFIYDPLKPAIALVHAGWQGSRQNIAVSTVGLMQKTFHTSAQDLMVSFGPAVRSCCYEVGEEFEKFFFSGLQKRNSRHYLDLVEVNKKQFLDLGVRENNIFDSRVCTYCKNAEFYSRRKEGKDCGRMISVMMLK